MLFYYRFGAKIEFVEIDVSHEVPTIFVEDELYDNSYDSVGNMLAFLLTNLKNDPIPELRLPDKNYFAKGVFRRFSQLEFLDSSIFEPHGFADYGYIYYPFRCIDGSVEKCKIHVVFPSCEQTTVMGGFAMMEDYGYGQYAASNDLIIL